MTLDAEVLLASAARPGWLVCPVESAAGLVSAREARTLSPGKVSAGKVLSPGTVSETSVLCPEM